MQEEGAGFGGEEEEGEVQEEEVVQVSDEWSAQTAHEVLGRTVPPQQWAELPLCQCTCPAECVSGQGHTADRAPRRQQD